MRSALHARGSSHVSRHGSSSNLGRAAGGTQDRDSQHVSAVRDIHHDAVLDEVKTTET